MQSSVALHQIPLNPYKSARPQLAVMQFEMHAEMFSLILQTQDRQVMDLKKKNMATLQKGETRDGFSIGNFVSRFSFTNRKTRSG